MSDFINRQDAIYALTEANLKSHMDSVEGGQENRSAIRIIMELPSADVVEVKHGEWAEEGYCPFCKCDMPAFIEDWEWKRCRTPYCPNCGARMEGEEDGM